MQKKYKYLGDFYQTEDIIVRWGDMDSYQHVNNTVYLKWIEHVRVNYFVNHICGPLQLDKLGFILAQQSCKYIYPISYPDTVSIGFRTTEILNDRLHCQSKIYSKTHKRIAAINESIIMAYDFEKNIKVDIPKSWRNKIEKIDRI